MKRQDAVLLQGVLIARFNEFARLAKEYLGIEIAPLNETGFCFALAQYNIKRGGIFLGTISRNLLPV